MSRIDRIYMDSGIYVYGYNWDHVKTAISDHNMVVTAVLKLMAKTRNDLTEMQLATRAR